MSISPLFSILSLYVHKPKLNIMRTLRNKNFDKAKFVEEATKTILNNGGIIVNDDFECKEYKIELDDNNLSVRLYGAKEQETVYCVFMRFETPLAGLGNSYSGKHNFFSVNNVDAAIKEFEAFLKVAIETNNNVVSFRKERVL